MINIRPLLNKKKHDKPTPNQNKIQKLTRLMKKHKNAKKYPPKNNK